MSQIAQIVNTSFIQALLELRANKMRSILSLLGITIGIFCIVAVQTVLDSMKRNISESVATLGSDVLYIGRWPWTADQSGEYKWWEYWRRPGMTKAELKAVESRVPGVLYSCLYINDNGLIVKYENSDVEGISMYGVTTDFDRIQSIDIKEGRYLSTSEIEGGNYVAVLGEEMSKNLFSAGINPVGKSIECLGRKLLIVGIMKKSGQNMAGFDFDNGFIFPYYAATNLIDIESLNYDPTLMVKAGPGVSFTEMKDETEGVLRSVRKVRPGEPSNFSMNQLSQVTDQINALFATIDVVGKIIAIFSLLVGLFGIANIMFVTVKERTKIIGLKKAIGAQRSMILMEFLIEAVVLCLFGGLIGIIAVLLLSLLLNYGLDFPVMLSVGNFFFGVFISAIVGILSGIIPAYRASRLDPVVAIRSQ